MAAPCGRPDVMGFSFRHSGVVTTHTIAAACQHLEEAFGEGYEFRPEPVLEGGIEMTKWPGKGPNQLKTARFLVARNAWPWIDDQDAALYKWLGGRPAAIWRPVTYDPWAGGDDSGLVTGSVIYRAWGGAPEWTVRQASKLASGFKKAGLLPVDLGKSLERLREKKKDAGVCQRVQ